MHPSLYRLKETRGWKDDDYIDQLRNSGVLIPVTIDFKAAFDKLNDSLDVTDMWDHADPDDVAAFAIVFAAAVGSL